MQCQCELVSEPYLIGIAPEGVDKPACLIIRLLFGFVLIQYLRDSKKISTNTETAMLSNLGVLWSLGNQNKSDNGQVRRRNGRKKELRLRQERS